uniref:Uncharacterized protein n=1 Tax=Ursus americanus TaxID=9643 RepID=A0A452RQM9_URSAM
MSRVQTPSCQGARAGVCPGEDTPKGRHVVTRVFREHTSLPLGLFALCFLGSSLLIPGPAWPQAGHALAYQVLSASSPLSPPGSSGPLLVSAAGGAGGRVAGRGVGARGDPSASSRPQAACVKDVSPKLRSCERLPDGRATFPCQADVFLSLRAADCRGA